MKILLVFPPQWNPTSPYLAVPLLAGQLRRAGHDVSIRDLNVEFFRSILRSEHLRLCLDTAKKQYDELRAVIPSQYPDAEKKFDTFPDDVRTRLLKFRLLDAFFTSRAAGMLRASRLKSRPEHCASSGDISAEDVVDLTDEAVRVMHDPVDFYDPEKLFDAKLIIQEALKIASLPYLPNEIIWDNYFADPLLRMDWANIASQCADRSVNMFIDFYEAAAGEIAEGNYDIVCISVPDLSQMISAFTLSSILKKKTQAHISVGGNYITQNRDSFLSHPEIFGDFVDSLMTGDGETSVLELARYAAGEITGDLVPGIIYKDGGRLVLGGKAPKLAMNDVAYADFDGCDLRAYFSPVTVMPFQLGKGCYWGKCEFCDYYYGQQCFDIKDIGRAIDELKYYNERYGADHFFFIDEAIPPEYYHRLARAITAAGLKICYYSFARLDRGFTPEVLEDMYASGARLLMWGYECDAPRLIRRMNKGIDPDTRLDILRSSHYAGIWNNALFIIGYPTETTDEIDGTLDVIRNNRDIINSCTPSNFSLKKNALMMKDVGKNGVISCESDGEFYTVCRDVIDGVSQQRRREIRREFHLGYITANSRCLWPVIYSDFDHLLAYLSKYGLDYVAGYRSDRNICPMFH